MAEFFDTDIKFLKGVGEKKGKSLETEFGIRTFRDLLFTFPFRHIDRSRFYMIRELSGEMPFVQLRGTFIKFYLEGVGAKTRLVGVFTDGERMMNTLWFSHINLFRDKYQPGKEYVIFGRPAEFHGVYSISHPEVSEYNPAAPPRGFEGVYNMTEGARKRGFGAKTLGGLVRNLTAHPGFATLRETLPPELLERYRLMPLREALLNMHFPETPALLQKAKERLKFEELFYLQLNILRFARTRSRSIAGRVFERIGPLFNDYYSRCIPFELTGAQKRVLHEIRNDTRTGRQMNRLLQGDVGSGKTMVAFMTLLMALDNGYQGALMAPTEILAAQHFETLSSWCAEIGVEIALLTGSTRAAERRRIHAGLLDGSIRILVGTHALIEDTVQFKNLGMVVIDEQHRFGVAQRARMWEKAAVPPHVLVMTATPIPRTLAMTVYGDLDVSVIDELPPGRKPVTTLLRYDTNRQEVNRLISRELAAGRQVYVVYPVITDNPKVELKSVETGYERICGLFPEYKVSCVHGRMKSDVKEAQMQRFVSGECRILVATTVIEVGVNVPNASVMVIENAERFGLSQLHQLRGRVGRGADRSYCVLVTKPNIGGDTKKRLGIMTETSDGFLVSEADMKLRGPGDMEGTQQSGLAFSLNVANLATDGQILTLAREAAAGVLNGIPGMELPGGRRDDVKIPLQAGSINILGLELRYRFAKTVDWSLIS